MMHHGLWDALALLSQDQTDSTTLPSLTSVPRDMSTAVHGCCCNYAGQALRHDVNAG
jgi:hypothetical protein